jgi:hypothetical protein
MNFYTNKVVYLKNVAGEIMEGKFPEDYSTYPSLLGEVSDWVDFILISHTSGKTYETPVAINMRNIVSIKPK